MIPILFVSKLFVTLTLSSFSMKSSCGCSTQRPLEADSQRKMLVSRSPWRSEAMWGTSMRTGPRNWEPTGPTWRMRDARPEKNKIHTCFLSFLVANHPQRLLHNPANLVFLFISLFFSGKGMKNYFFCFMIPTDKCISFSLFLRLLLLLPRLFSRSSDKTRKKSQNAEAHGMPRFLLTVCSFGGKKGPICHRESLDFCPKSV